ncbi:hypothetical protein TRIUR3_29372 [Triticum urartu]|uniref:Uncharacterized protein n=1 Tax=Triticum urartu TaxID=4572 RepID=M7ZX82_TRIUA|nr:hypothetical protein TRIUR3_29372 [Triticum urartu]
MASAGGDTKGRKRKFLPHGKPFYEDLVDGKVFDEKPKNIPDKPLNKKIKFDDSDSSDDEDQGHSVEEANNGNDAEKGEAKSSEQQQEVPGALGIASKEDEEQVETAGGSAPKKQRIEDPLVSEQTEPKAPTDEPAETTDDKPKESTDKPAETTDDKPKESTDKPTETSDKPKASNDKPKEFTGKPKASNDKPIDDLIDEDLKQLGDRKKIPVQLRVNLSKIKFILRVLPAEVVCYASEEEITRAVAPLVEKYFPKESPSGHKLCRFSITGSLGEAAAGGRHCRERLAGGGRVEDWVSAGGAAADENPVAPGGGWSGAAFAVLYEARSNTGIDRMKIINAVAKSIPQPHKVDLSNPDRTIIVQIAKE